MNGRTTGVLGWLMFALALVLSFCSVVTWQEHMRLIGDELYLSMAVVCAIFALACALAVWGGKFRPVPLLLAAAVAGWMLFLGVLETISPGWPIPVLLAVCVGGAICLMTLVLLVCRATRKSWPLTITTMEKE